jgi:hypothetical protein
MDEIQSESKIENNEEEEQRQPEIKAEQQQQQQTTVTGEFVQTEIVKLTVVKQMN